MFAYKTSLLVIAVMQTSEIVTRVNFLFEKITHSTQLIEMAIKSTFILGMSKQASDKR